MSYEKNKLNKRKWRGQTCAFWFSPVITFPNSRSNTPVSQYGPSWFVKAHGTPGLGKRGAAFVSNLSPKGFLLIQAQLLCVWYGWLHFHGLKYHHGNLSESQEIGHLMYFIHPFARERDRAIELSPFLHFQTELIFLYSLDSEKAFSQRGNRDPSTNAKWPSPDDPVQTVHILLKRLHGCYVNTFRWNHTKRRVKPYYSRAQSCLCAWVFCTHSSEQVIRHTA